MSRFHHGRLIPHNDDRASGCADHNDEGFCEPFQLGGRELLSGYEHGGG
jgi:hypothetical protein